MESSESARDDERTITGTNDAPKRDRRFWMLYGALCLTMLLSGLDLGGVATVAPAIVQDLNGSDFTWVGSAYALSSSAFLPLGGNLAQVFGRRPVLLGAIVVLAIGSAISGSATSILILTFGRVIQGAGGGVVQLLPYIVVADLVPLIERGTFNGTLAIMLTIGSVIGPAISGVLRDTRWRWLFYINLPICLVMFILVMYLLRLSAPKGNISSKLKEIDWIGNFLVITSTFSCTIGLTWGGIRYSWASVNVLTTLIAGIVGLAVFVLYEAKWATRPTIPMHILFNRDGFFGCVATFIHGIIAISVGYYLPAWFKAVGLATSGLYFVPIGGTIPPTALAQALIGLIVTKTKRYCLVNFVGWCCITLGMGLFIYMDPTTHVAVIIVFEVITGVGVGFLYATTFTILSPLDASQNAAAMTLITYFRTFSQAWGIALTGNLLQDGLRRHLPSSVLQASPSGVQIAFTIIPRIPSMPLPLQIEVRQAFQDSMHRVWIVMEVTCVGGFLGFCMMRDLPLHSDTEKIWGMMNNDAKEVPVDSEKGMPIKAASTSLDEKHEVAVGA